MKQAWTIPFEGINYLCWTDRNKVRNRPLSRDEERGYFNSVNKDRFLNDLLN